MATSLTFKTFVRVLVSLSALLGGTGCEQTDSRSSYSRDDSWRGDYSRGDSSRGDSSRGDSSRGDFPRGDFPRGRPPQPQTTDAPVMIQTDAASYSGNSPVTVRLTNRTGRRVGYNLCRSRVEQQNNEGDWVMTQPVAEACTAELRSLSPGQSTTFSFRPARNSRPGPYRIRTTLEDLQGGRPTDVISNSFRLTRDE